MESGTVLGWKIYLKVHRTKEDNMKSTEIIQPSAMSAPIAHKGSKFDIPETSTGTEQASIEEGFPDITMIAPIDGGLPPRGQDCNGMFYLSTDMRVYQQNGGIITFSQDVSNVIGGYPKGAILDYIDENGQYTKVRSLIENNTNNFVTNPEFIDNINWERLSFGNGVSRNLGEYVYSSIPISNSTLHLADGSLLDGSGIYERFVSYIANLYGEGPEHPAYFTTEEEWQESVETYGVCGKFVYNASANTIRLPKVTGLIEGTLDINTLGMLTEAGLPNMDANGLHTHSRGNMNITGQCWANNRNGDASVTGAFVPTSTPSPWGAGGSGSIINFLATFNAANTWTGSTSQEGTHTHTMGSLLGKSNTVQPQTIKGYIYIVVATYVKTDDIEIDIDNVITDLNGKANIALDNLTPAGEKHFINKTQVTNAILETPNGVCTYSGNTITAKSGLKVLAPNGRNEDGSLKNIEYTLASDTSKELTSAGTGLGVFFLRSLDNGQTWDIGYRLYGTQWYIQEEQPQVQDCEWYNPKTNLWKHCVSGEWSDILICPLGRVSYNEGQIISLYNYETTDLLKRSDRGEIIEWDRPNLTQSGSQLKGYNTVYIAEEDGWVQFNSHVQCTANYLTPTSYIQVYGIIDEINVFGHMLRCNWDGGGNTVGSATMQTLITRIYRGQTYKLYTQTQTGNSSVVSYELRFIPLAKKGA